MHPTRNFWLRGLVACGWLIGCGGGSEDETVAPDSNTPPTVDILSPASGDHVPLNEASTLMGKVDDAETDVEALSIVWESDAEGSLGSSTADASGNAELRYSFRDQGEQRITLTVTDGQGRTSEDTVDVWVDAAPSAEITGVEPSAPAVGEEVTFFGIVSDLDEDARNLSIKWLNADGETIGTSPADRNGNVELTTDSLPAGNRQTITLQVADALGQVAEATVKIDVEDCADDDRDDFSTCDDDCDDADASVYPGAEEICDGIDQDCNDIVDNGFPDSDRDQIADCVDVEECDGLDNDGDGEIDEGFADSDSDGITDCQDSCDFDTNNDVDNDGVCGDVDGCPTVSDAAQTDSDGDGLGNACDSCPDDSNNDIDLDEICGNIDNCPTTANPSQTDTDGNGDGDACSIEICDQLDNDGDGLIDEGFVETNQDGDEFTNCAGDCNDNDNATYPGAPERCDGKDNDCDGNADEDDDRDQYTACTGDCNDQSSAVYPGATEICDGLDNNCDSVVDGDMHEPNNSLETARFIGDVNGVDYPIQTTVNGTIHAAGDSDFYKIDLVDDFAGGNDLFYLDVVLTSIPTGVDADLFLYWDGPNINGTDINQIKASENSDQQDEHVNEQGDSGPDNGGSYWIEVRWKYGANCGLAYSLIIENMG